MNEVHAVYVKSPGFSTANLARLCVSEGVADREVFAITGATSQHSPQRLSWTRVDIGYTTGVCSHDRVPGKVVTCWETNEVPTIRVYITRIEIKQGEAVTRLADVLNAC